MQTVIASLCDAIAILDERGVIISVNRVWRTFAATHGGSAALAAGVGIDYLAVVRRSAANDALAALALRGLEDVLAGRETLFTLCLLYTSRCV